MVTKHLVPDPAAVDCTFTIPADVEESWRNGDRDALAQAVTQIARDAATFCATRYEQNLAGEPHPSDPLQEFLDS
jgi:hypothetical protein